MNNMPGDPLAVPTRIVLFGDNDALPHLLLATDLVDDLELARTVVEMDAIIPTLKSGWVFISGASDSGSLPDVIHGLRPRLPHCRLVALSPADDSDHVVACLRAGADDFLSLRFPIQLPARLSRVLADFHLNRPRRSMDKRFKTLADSAPALVWITDDSGNFIHFNRPWLDFTGRRVEAELGQGWLNALLPEDRSRFCNEFEEHFKQREPFRIDFRLRRQDGLLRWLTCQGIPHYEDDEFFTGYIGSCLDVSEQHEAETLLAYRAITQAALAGFGRFALSQHNLQEIRQEAACLLCDILQLDFSEVLLFEPSESDTLIPAFTNGFPPGFVHAPVNAAEARATGDSHLRLPDDAAIFPGRENHAALNVRSGLAAPINNGNHVVGFLTGLSTETRTFGREAFDFIQALVTIISTVHQRNLAELALQESEIKLLQSQKMEAVGLLAGGVAHDFNNLLTAVRCYGDMLHEDLADIAPELRAKTAEILKAAARASALTRQLLAFSRKQVLQPEVLDMNGVIEDLRDLVRSLLSESVSIEVRLAVDTASFKADRNQIDQVVLNLCLNARDAMPQGGLLTLAVGVIEISGPNPHGLPPGEYVQLTVSDTGTGMDADVQSRLFQPFFTTKPVGRGTGLGLATCAVIIKNCDGIITFESKLGQGTGFHLFLPRIEPPHEDFFQEQEEQDVTGREHILVVEDDEAIRQIAVAILDTLGYQVTVVPDGNHALSLFQTTPPPSFDLLLTDVIMPDIDGFALARRIQAIHTPGLRTLFMSGFLGNAATVQAVADYNLPFLEKPFTLDVLARKVRDVLDSAPVMLPPIGDKGGKRPVLPQP